MADSINPNKNKVSSFLPRFYRSDSNKKFTQATLDQLVQPGTVDKLNGFVGRQNAKASTGKDIFIKEISDQRQNYQLEPGMVIKDDLDNVTFFKDYIDYINQIDVFSGNVKNHARLNKQEFYSWDPHIEWDKFVNFQNYYWLPYGPDVIAIAGQQQAIESTYTVVVESQGDSLQYVFSPNGLTRNPTIKLFKGQTYKFEINSPGNPFSIKTTRSLGTLDRYNTFGLDGVAVENGTITFTVPTDAPDVLFYVSESDIDLGGVFQLFSITENTKIDVEAEIIGKKNYTLTDGTVLSNGMKVKFTGGVTPQLYASDEYYVEGVGTAIILVKQSELALISTYTQSESILFDSTPFDNMPFSDATAFAGTPDYIVINRASLDKNQWSRYNRWFHKDVVNISAEFNNKIPSLDQTARAVRPIIEFEAGIKLFNFGLQSIVDIDLIDTYTPDVFSTIEGSSGYNVDGVQLVQGQRILFTADTDSFVQNKIYRVEFIDVLHLNTGSRQIHLVLETEPALNDVVLIKQGILNVGKSYWFDGTTWNVGQQKTVLNQSPLFDIVDDNGISYGDTNTYEGSTFIGTNLFSYKIGSGTNDSTLGFPLTYKNISNIGDIVFNFNILTDTFRYKNLADVIDKDINVGYLTKFSTETKTISYTNGWKTALVSNTQAAVRIYKNSNITNNFDIDIFDNKDDLTDLIVRLYVNGRRLDKALWSIITGPVYKKIILATDITVDDVLTIRAFAAQVINTNGYYETPINLQNNPLNNNLADFTLGEVIDHVSSIVDNIDTFEGAYPGAGNLRDLGDVTPYGTKFVQHSGPMGLSLYHITNQENNIIRAIETSKNDYNKFKRNFISIIDTLEVYSTDVVTQVNLILQAINKDKPSNISYYFSDMLGYGANQYNEYTVIDFRITSYPLVSTFSLGALSNQAVYVYLNGTHLIYSKDYTFDSQGFVVIKATLHNDDTIAIVEYENTDGCFIPQTPTKLGIWPKYEPKIYLDTSLVTPRTMIQGHDGSQVLAYGDYRDDLILELEKRIYNNIKVEYDASIFDINDFLPSYVRHTDYNLTEFNEILSTQFYKWTRLIDRDFSKPLSFDRENSLTYNYQGHTAIDGRPVPGYWRGIYRWMLDTDRPNLCPWEMLGFSEAPIWWETVYGPAPYTRDNLILWQDLSEGQVKEPGAPIVRLSKYVRPFLTDSIPVDENGEILGPILSNLVIGPNNVSVSNDFVFGDVSPIEAAWRRGSYYPFSFLITAMLTAPAKTFGVLLDRSRVIRNLTGQLVYKDTGLRIRPQDVVLPSIYSSTSRVQTAGVINYIIDYVLSDNLRSYTTYSYNLKHLNMQLSYRLGAFTSKEKFNLLLDSKTPSSSGSVFVPQEDYNVILNVSSAVKRISYSGIVVTKLPDGFEVKGYSQVQPYFKYFPYIKNGPTINVGGISESYSSWTSNEQYAFGKVVKYNNRYYRVKVAHVSANIFNSIYFETLGALPIIGGQEAIFRTEWDTTVEITVPYGTKFRTIQETVDFIISYGEWLKSQGFIFDDFNNNLALITNWETSAKEFLFWTTQNWSSGQEKWKEWSPYSTTEYQDIIRYNGDYYQAIRKSVSNIIFIEEDYVKLDGLSTVGSSVISLSPSANKITFSVPYTVVDDIKNPFHEYEIFKVDGSPVAPQLINSYREDNSVSYASATDGIFGATFFLVQKEQVVLLNNTTMFNDTIYNPESGYRQERIKVTGYVSTNWYGGFDVPGFIFDQANIQPWTSWTDYALGDIVKYKEFYYSANQFAPGTELFEPASWIKLDNKPTPRLIPNWTYKASQFEDFYSLDSDNFDVGQQKAAQHLIGYQKRQYLENIIKDDVSEFKFYQGMIIEKGTQNVLNKLFDVLSAEGQESIVFDEEWAVRVGQYGASAAFENIEFILDESLFKNNPQGFELVDNSVSETLDFIVRQPSNDVYLKPLGYNNNPWPVVKKYSPYLRTPGYVRENEVAAVLVTIDNIVTQNIDNINNGDYIWCGFEGREWNVYKYVPLNLTILNVIYNAEDSELFLETDVLVKINVGEYIGIEGDKDLDGNEQITFKGFYKVKRVELNVLILEALLSSSPTFTPNLIIPVFVLQSQRVSSIDTADTTIKQQPIDGDLLWTDDAGDSKWATWKFNHVYESTTIAGYLPTTGLEFGRTITLNKDGNISAISSASGDVLIYSKSVPGVPWATTQRINKPFTSLGLVIWSSANAYPLGTIVFYVNSWYQANSIVPSNVVPSSSVAYWTKIYFSDTLALSADGSWLAVGSPAASDVSVSSTVSELITVNRTGTPSGLINQGVVSLYKKDNAGLFSLINTFTSPAAVDNELFGSNLAFGDNTLFVSAAGRNNNAGRVYQLNYTAVSYATALYNPIGSDDDTIKTTTPVGTVVVGMEVVGVGFTSGQTVKQILSSTLYVLTAPPDTEPSGRINFVTTQWVYNNNTGLDTGLASEDQFGYALDVSGDSSTLAVSAPNAESVYVYKKIAGTFILAQTITGSIAASEVLGETTLTVTNSGTGAYVINGESNPMISFMRGHRYIINVNAVGHPFWIQTVSGAYSSANIYNTGVTNNGTQSGTITVEVASDAPQLYYACRFHAPMAGSISVSDFGPAGATGLTGLDSRFGESITLSNTAEYLAISSILADSAEIDQGAVRVYKKTAGSFVFYQSLKNVMPEAAEHFGSKISFMNDYNSIVVYSTAADTYVPTTFDSNTTIFDDNLTKITSRRTNSGQVDIYDRYANNWVFSESLPTNNYDYDRYGTSVVVGANHIFVSAPGALDRTVRAGLVYEYSKIENRYSWSILHKEINKLDLTKIKSAFLYNKTTNKLLTYLDVLDPVQGKIPGVAEQEIKYKTFYDPAVYCLPLGTAVPNTTVTIDDGMAWTKSHVGMLWWDLRSAKFLDSHDNDTVYRNSTWSTLFPGASIDVYEWVETQLLPAAWNEQADTDAGTALGISGTTLYGNNVYSYEKRYDNVAKTNKYTYYYWVKNKKTIPNVINRSMSSQDVANLISNPRGEGYKFLALTSTNTFSLFNVANLLEDKDVVLSVQYWIVDHTDQNIHSQWKIISKNTNTVLPLAIETKWFDSLCGKDDQGRLVPDPNLPPKLQFGVENRPRQGMFSNRFEALKQFFEKTNLILSTTQVVGNADLTRLESYDPEPNINLGLYDTVFDTDAELRFANVGAFKLPVLVPVVVNGTITSINIIIKGNGYVNAPYIDISGVGTGAKIKTVINAKGQIVGTSIISSGIGYDDTTTASVRAYSALVHADAQALDTWSIYSYDLSTLTWSRVRSQNYDTRKYWKYADWYSPEYGQYSLIDYAVDTFVELTLITTTIGQVVKVRTTSGGTWLLLKKYAQSISVDWAQSYKVVGIQNGTIQFLPELYKFSGTPYGYDGSLYDGAIFDNSAGLELRNILICLQKNILIDELKQYYLDLFFVCVRYAYSEQNYLDWIFKTSFVKAQHNVGELTQKVNYNSDNLSDFEAYITEVKPYRTKVREYISSYSKMDTSKLSLADFDLQPTYRIRDQSTIETKIVDEVIQVDDSLITSYPWKHWADNVGFTVTELKIVDGGSGYHLPPVIRIASRSGTGATARAFISNGKVNRVILLTPGSNYLNAPTVLVEGGLDEGGVPAQVVAYIGNGIIRSSLIKMKFDRVTQNYFITKLEETESFIGTGSRLQFPLKWSPDIRVGKSSVRINGVDVLRDDYRLSTVKSTAKGYTSYAGSIIFTNAIAKDAVILVSYLKDWSLLNAADRIQYYYNPQTGDIGKDLAQLMTGVDYGGVILNGLGLNVSQGWDSTPYYTDRWDSVDATFDDYIVAVSAGTRVFTLPYVPETGVEINTYHIKLYQQSYSAIGLDYQYDVAAESLKVVISKTVTTVVVNAAGGYILSVPSTTGISVNDIITTSVNNIFGYNTKVTEIINSTSLRLDQIIFGIVAIGSNIVVTRALVKNIDYIVSIIGLVSLTQSAPVGSTITISSPLNPIRLDPDVVNTFIGDGDADVITLPIGYIVNAGDEFIFRKSTSDGSIKPQEADYDTALTGGNLAYSSATGLNAEDIIVDGDGFVTPTTSPATEEVVPGQIFDTVAIKVYEKPSAGSANIKVDNYIGDNTTVEYAITQQINSPQAVIVKITDGSTTSIIKTMDDDYVVNFNTGTITFNTAPTITQVVSIFSFGFSGSNILDLDYFVGNGITTEFITKAPWLSDITSLVYLDGIPEAVELFETDDTYESNNRVGIRFDSPPPAGTIINFVIVSGNEQTFAITKTERIAADGRENRDIDTGLLNGSSTYTLQNKIGNSLPAETSMIVRVDQTILSAANNIYHKIKSNKLIYTVDKNTYQPYSLDISDIIVYVGNTMLTLGTDYVVDLSVISIKITARIRNLYVNQQLVISVTKNSLTVGKVYTYLPGINNTQPQIVFNQVYNSSNIIEVISSYRHDILDMQRTTVTVSSDISFTPDTIEYFNYTGISGGIIKLDRTVISDNYVWMMCNGKLLVPSIDFKLNSDKQSITLSSYPAVNDEFTLLTFNSNVLKPGISYMQFKDMLNRVHYKRLSLNKQTALVRDLDWNDTVIEIVDASNFDEPNPIVNKPGVIEIRGERIEYFTKSGNMLSQLRRGTLGTGTPTVHRAGSFVQDIGPGESIPYIENTIIEQVTADGSNTVSLTKITPGLYSFKNPNTNLTKTLPHDIEVFVGGYNIGAVWASNVSYAVGMFITLGSYTYKCVTAHISANTFHADISKWVFFIGNIRLKKDEYKVYNVNNHPDSTDGDVQFDAEFTVDGVTKQLILATPLTFGTQVTIVKRTLTYWDSATNILNDNNKISGFLKAEPGIWYTEFKMPIQDNAPLTSTFDSSGGTFDSNTTTFDQG